MCDVQVVSDPIEGRAASPRELNKHRFEVVKAEERIGRHGEREIVDRNNLTVLVAEMRDFDSVRHAPAIPMPKKTAAMVA